MRKFAPHNHKDKPTEGKSGFTLEEILGEEKVLELKLKISGIKYEKDTSKAEGSKEAKSHG